MPTDDTPLARAWGADERMEELVEINTSKADYHWVQGTVRDGDWHGESRIEDWD